MSSSPGATSNAAPHHDPIYQDLRKEVREFRLLDCSTLAGTSDGSTLNLKMVTRQLESVDYHTLSYVWGDASKTRPATLNGHPVNITLNLDDALRHLQCAREDSMDIGPIDYLWVDALCINQNDNIEKSHQVAMMAETYAESKAVIMWLGSEDQDSKAALQLASDWYQTIHADESISEAYNSLIAPGGDTSAGSLEKLITTMRSHVETHHPALLSPPRHAALNAFLARPYWTRVWTLQEQVLPMQSLLLCGNTTLNTLQFWVALTAIQHAPFGARDHGGSPPTTPSNAALIVHRKRFLAKMAAGLDGEETPPLHAELFVWSACGIYRPRPKPPLKDRDDLASKLDMLYLLRSHDFESTDPRDRIFALLGLVASEERTVTPDYQMSVARAYTAFWEGELRRAERLDMLACGGMGQTPQQEITGLPSWVPDFRRVLDATPWQVGLKVDASGGAEPCALAWPKAGQMTLIGVFVDEITGAVNVPGPEIPLHVALWEIISASRGLGLAASEAKPPDWSWPRILFWTFTHFIDMVVNVPEHLVEQVTVAVNVSAAYHFLTGIVNGARLAGADMEELCSALHVDTIPSKIESADVDEVTETLLYKLFPCDAETLELVKNREGNIWYWGIGLLSLGLRNLREHEGRSANSLFVTSGGFTGWSKSTTETGDRICVVPGCRLPLILRSTKEELEGHFKLVAWGLIYGMMDGDVVRMFEAGQLEGVVEITLV